MDDKKNNLVVNTIDNSADPLAVRMMTKCTFCVFVLLDDGVSSYSFVVVVRPPVFFYMIFYCMKKRNWAKSQDGRRR